MNIYFRNIAGKALFLLFLLCTVNTTTVHAQLPISGEITALLNRINHELDFGSSQMALSLIDDVIPLIENNNILLAELFLLRGNIHFFARRFDLVIPDVLYSIELNPSDARSHEHLAVTYLEIGKHADALQAINRALGIDPHALRLFNARAAINIAMGNNEIALHDVDYVLDIDPNFADALAHKGAILSNMGNIREGLSYLDRAIAINPMLTESFRNRGFTNFFLGHDELAFNDFTRAIELGSQDPEVFHHRALLHWRMGNYHEGYLDISMAIQLSPENIDFYLLRVGYHMNRGNIVMGVSDLFEVFILLGDEGIKDDFMALFHGMNIEDIDTTVFSDKLKELLLGRDPNILQRIEDITGIRIE